MSAPGGPPARTGRILADWGPRDIPRTRPPKPVPIDLDALAEFNRGVQRARTEYAIHPFSGCPHHGHCPRKEAS